MLNMPSCHGRRTHPHLRISCMVTSDYRLRHQQRIPTEGVFVNCYNIPHRFLTWLGFPPPFGMLVPQKSQTLRSLSFLPDTFHLMCLRRRSKHLVGEEKRVDGQKDSPCLLKRRRKELMLKVPSHPRRDDDAPGQRSRRR